MLAERAIAAELIRRFNPLSTMSRVDRKLIFNHLTTGCYTTNERVRGETDGTMLALFVVPRATQSIIDGDIALTYFGKEKKKKAPFHTCIVTRPSQVDYKQSLVRNRQLHPR